MSSVWICSDLHLLHENIWKQRYFVDSTEENTQLFFEDYNSTVKKDDTIIFLGDICFNEKAFELLARLRGKKILVKGNHDTFDLKYYTDIFSDIHGLLFKHGFIYSHCPIHDEHLRHGRKNIHGHLHTDTVNIKQNWIQKLLKLKPKEDKRYFNVCPENLHKLGLGTKNGYLISLDQLRKYLDLRGD